MPELLELDGASLTIADVVRVARDNRVKVLVGARARDRLATSRAIVESAISGGRTMYGINTGFGKLANVSIPPDQLEQLQVNLIRSHAAGVGDPLPADVVRGLICCAQTCSSDPPAESVLR
jgi:histidine ammonia-lyase